VIFKIEENLFKCAHSNVFDCLLKYVFELRHECLVRVVWEVNLVAADRKLAPICMSDDADAAAERARPRHQIKQVLYL
jgi:hypothetical protein